MLRAMLSISRLYWESRNQHVLRLQGPAISTVVFRNLTCIAVAHDIWSKHHTVVIFCFYFSLFLLVRREYILPKRESRQVVAPSQETTTGAAGASEPLCIAQGAAANVPKFPRPHPHSSPPPHSASPARPPPLITPAAPSAGPRHYKHTHSTVHFQHVFCTPLPETTYHSGTRGRHTSFRACIKPLTRR